MTPPQKSALAEVMLKSRKMNPGTYAVNDIPEMVVIKDLADQYKPCEFTHRKQVLALLKGMQGNTLAEYFHRDPGTMCQGCHHYSPACQEAAPLRQLPQRRQFAGQRGESSGPAGGVPRAVHELPQGHEAGEAGGHGVHRVSPGKEEVTALGCKEEYVMLRRTFLGLLGAAGVGAALGKPAHAAGTPAFPGISREFRRAVRRHPLHRLPQMRGRLQPGQRTAAPRPSPSMT